MNTLYVVVEYNSIPGLSQHKNEIIGVFTDIGLAINLASSDGFELDKFAKNGPEEYNFVKRINNVFENYIIFRDILTFSGNNNIDECNQVNKLREIAKEINNLKDALNSKINEAISNGVRVKISTIDFTNFGDAVRRELIDLNISLPLNNDKLD